MRPLRALVRLLLAAALVLGGVSVALAFFASTGTGTASAKVGSLVSHHDHGSDPGGRHGRSHWNPVSAPAAGSVTYYVSRPGGGTVGGTCPSSAAERHDGTSCTDSGLSKGTYTYTVTAVWQSWTATSGSTPVSLASGALSKFSVSATSSATAGNAVTVTITAQDSSGNTVTSYSGAQAITFSGPANAPSGTDPSYPGHGHLHQRRGHGLDHPLRRTEHHADRHPERRDRHLGVDHGRRRRQPPNRRERRRLHKPPALPSTSP